MSFKFRSAVIYERLISFTKDIYNLTSKLPDYEQNGLIARMRNKSHDLVHEAAEGLSKPKNTEIELSMKNCISLVSHITADIDIAQKLGYLDTATHNRALILAEEITRYLHETKDAQ